MDRRDEQISWSIGELSQQVGVPVETIRYYERAGVLDAPARSPSGRRTYTAEQAGQLVFIRRARDPGFSFAQVKRLLDLSVGQGGAAEAARIAAAHLAETRARIAELEALAGQLTAILGEGGEAGGAALLSQLGGQ